MTPAASMPIKFVMPVGLTPCSFTVHFVLTFRAALKVATTACGCRFRFDFEWYEGVLVDVNLRLEGNRSRIPPWPSDVGLSKLNR